MKDEDKKGKKCTECGAELKPGEVCELCAAKEREIEVEMKKFKISEVLDIRVRPPREKK